MCIQIYGFKPSAGRISGQGVVNSLSGVDSILGTLGPFARSLRDLVLFSKVYTEAEPWTSDVSIIPYPIGTPLTRAAGRPLRVGIMTDDGVISPLPPVRSIVQDVWGKLRASSLVRVTEFNPLHHDQAWSIITANYFEGGATKIRQLCEDGSEPVLPLTDWILSTAGANEAALAETPQERRAARDAFRKIYSDHWNASDVDVVMAPVTPSVAPPLGTSRSWTYTSIWNLLDYPAIAFPASKMIGGQSTDLKGQSYLPKTELEAFYYEHYDAEVAQKLPVGLQLVSKRLTENELFGAMEVIESVLKT
jgi:amidase